MLFRESGHVEAVPFPKQLVTSSSRLPFEAGKILDR
jgi:hypothetical protein